MTANTFFHSRFLRAHAWSSLFGLLLSGCSTLGSFGADTFTFKGELPADFALKAQAHYGASEGCSGRGHVETFKKDFDKAPHGYQFKIPVSYRDGLCDLQLVRVGLFIYTKYGEQDWQETYDNGGLMVVEELPLNAPTFKADGTLFKTARCSWLFQISKLELGIAKMLDCKGAGAYLMRNVLPKKTITLNLELGGNDRPYMRNYWKKTAAGWKPCTGRWGTSFEELCTAPPQFRTFTMDGRTCTVYPNCTE
ncbi:hypothetical protein NAV33_16920 [Pseudomonas stutzeri]|uniref:hypothetical protein n=1 Tax=Stutzerimonas stutzeri TaxID=316 RepID=UPI002109E05B|nr:hypothetical protein [Stutzerimonas stutzeri]MCQ4313556.1 hypothetical protein [Stutzerimonas stutzeri]